MQNLVSRYPICLLLLISIIIKNNFPKSELVINFIFHYVVMRHMLYKVRVLHGWVYQVLCFEFRMISLHAWPVPLLLLIILMITASIVQAFLIVPFVKCDSQLALRPHTLILAALILAQENSFFWYWFLFIVKSVMQVFLASVFH